MRIISIITLMVLFVGVPLGFAQDLPADFLGSDFHKTRRDILRTRMPANSVAVFFANPVRNRANDTDYLYHQDPNFYYLTGYREPHAILLIFKDNQTDDMGDPFNEIAFVQPRKTEDPTDRDSETWTGRRLGPTGFEQQLGIRRAFDNYLFGEYSIDFSEFDKVLFDDFQNDVRDTENEGDLYDLISWFKKKAGYPSGNAMEVEPIAGNLDTQTLDYLMGEMRGVKTKEELELLRKAIDISCIAQVEVMKAIKPGMSEREIQGIHEFIYRKYQAEDEGYNSIVGAGHNGCILHYIDNYKPTVEGKEMILMDLGAEYHGYTADVTRTIPIDGKFSKEEKAIYDLVYKAQEAAIKACRPGIDYRIDLDAQIARRIVNEGLAELKIIKSADSPNSYYPHGLSHQLGLDVHDPGGSKLRPNMVITIEPGIYIPDNSPCDKKWWGIAVRIEDDLLITENGCELLSDIAPRKSEDIEALMAKPSPFDNIILPELDASQN